LRQFSDNPNVHEYGVSSEDVFNFMIQLCQEQKKFAQKGDFVSYVFFLDSVDKLRPLNYLKGMITKNGNIIDSESLKTQNQQKTQIINNSLEFFVDNYIKSTITSNVPFTNTMFGVLAWQQDTQMGIVTAKRLGGDKQTYIADSITTIGGKQGLGGEAIYKTVRGEEYFIGLKVAVSFSKIHQNTFQTSGNNHFVVPAKGKVIGTPRGFIESSDSSVEAYKKANMDLFKLSEDQKAEFLNDGGYKIKTEESE
jgi:hypothetical protein